jgi:aminopeptidase N
MPPYDVFLAAHDKWKVHESKSGEIALHAYVYERDADAAAAIYGDVPAALDFYGKTFGPFLWGKDMRYVEMPMYAGGMENATCVGMDDTMFPKSERAEARHVAFHELAHHWSGNGLRIHSWNDFWLSEGFTEYLTRRFVESHDGADAGRAMWRDTLRAGLAAEADRLHPVRPPDPEKDVLGFFDDVVYEKGSWVLKMLEHRVGREAMDDLLRAWFAAHRFKSATTADFVKHAETKTGQSLDRFFADWIYGSGHPEIRAKATRVDDRTVEVTVEQVQKTGLFELPVEIEIGQGAQSARVVVSLKNKTATARVAASFDPARIVVDPDEKAYLVATCDTGSRCRDGYRCGAGNVCLPQ